MPTKQQAHEHECMVDTAIKSAISSCLRTIKNYMESQGIEGYEYGSDPYYQEKILKPYRLRILVHSLDNLNFLVEQASSDINYLISGMYVRDLTMLYLIYARDLIKYFEEEDPEMLNHLNSGFDNVENLNKDFPTVILTRNAANYFEQPESMKLSDLFVCLGNAVAHKELNRMNKKQLAELAIIVNKVTGPSRFFFHHFHKKFLGAIRNKYGVSPYHPMMVGDDCYIERSCKKNLLDDCELNIRGNMATITMPVEQWGKITDLIRD